MRGWKQGMKRIGAALLAAVILMLPMTAFAGEITETPSAITIEYRDHNNGALNGVVARIYKVASVKGGTVDGAVKGYDITYTLDQQFQRFDEKTGSGPRITGFSEEALNENLIIRKGEGDNARRARWQSIARTLESYASAYVRPSGNQTSAGGRVSFTNLTPGLYLLLATGPLVKEDDADYRYTYQPTFVMVPSYENGLWDYSRDLTFGESDVILRPKYTYERVEHNYVVYKRWSGDTTSNTRPSSIRINIYRDGSLWRTVTLDSSNDWTYRWTAGSQTFRVEEIDPGEYYSVSIDTSKTGTIEITNTYNPPDEEGRRRTPPPPPEEVEPPEVLGIRRLPSYEPLEEPEVLGMRRLPRTGQLDWPVPVLAIAGLVLFGIGFYRNRSNA